MENEELNLILHSLFYVAYGRNQLKNGVTSFKFFLMNNIAIKAALHERIETINDDKILEAVYTLLENAVNHTDDYKLSDEQLNLLIERDKQYQNGEMKTMSLDELKSEIRNKFNYGI